MATLGSNPVQAGQRPTPRIRRRHVRQRVHTPAYASLNGSSSGQFLDLSEIVDIHEEGMAIQASSPLEVQHSVNLCLDLTATKACIHTTGEVIWADGSGRVGIRFPQMPDQSFRQLKEWLFVNLLVACANQRAEPFSGNEFSQVVPQAILETQPHDSALVNWMRQELEPTAPADYTSVLTALAAVKREVESLGSDLDRALELLAQRAQTFTRATGAAIALTEGAEMICRASAGQDAPGMGARFSIGSGFSGECVRTGRLLSCEDSETDPVVDRESCRALGIRSMVAVPVRWEDAVIGLLEVFSPEPYAFSSNDSVVLERLAGICSSAVHRAGALKPDSPEDVFLQPDSREPVSKQASSAPVTCVDDEFPVETAADLPLPRLSRSRKILLAAAAATVVFAASWLISPRDTSRFAGPGTAPQQPAKSPSQPAPAAAVAADTLEGMRKLAEQGDPAAQFSVGARYATGEDVPQDYAEAVRWFTMAAEQGHVISQGMLGEYYREGRGVPQDFVKAYFWSVLAQAGGDEASKYRVAHLVSRMKHAQIAAAQQQANDWIKEHQSLSQNSPIQH
jgi:putative methionine-R-sulfoxide reductase with GAF domain